jgi:hypothetical protein
MNRFLVRFAIVFEILCAGTAYAQVTIVQLESDLVSPWLVTVAGESRTRTLTIKGVAINGRGTFFLDADYGWSGEKLGTVKPEISQAAQERKLTFSTPAGSKIVATQMSNGVFSGTFALKNGETKAVTLEKIGAMAHQEQTSSPKASGGDIAVRENSIIDIVYMGGPDCPPCRNWKIFDLPKLQASKEFQHIRFTEVKKWIRDSVPDTSELPEHLRPMRDELVRVIARPKGSPFFALLVDGKGIKGGWGTDSYEALRPIMNELVVRKLSAVAKNLSVNDREPESGKFGDVGIGNAHRAKMKPPIVIVFELEGVVAGHDDSHRGFLLDENDVARFGGKLGLRPVFRL